MLRYFCLSLTLTILFAYGAPAGAEYRVFLLRITKKAPPPKTDAAGTAPTDAQTAAPTDAQTAAPTDAQTAAPTDAPTAAPTDATNGQPVPMPTPPAEIIVREFPSTLDPLQYPTYYPVASDEFVSYTATWRCKGRTNDKPLCPNPRAPAPQNGEAPAPSDRSPANTPGTEAPSEIGNAPAAVPQTPAVPVAPAN